MHWSKARMNYLPLFSTHEASERDRRQSLISILTLDTYIIYSLVLMGTVLLFPLAVEALFSVAKEVKSC